MTALTGLGVLVTRPEAQGRALAARLRLAGARVWSLPAIEIHPLPRAEPGDDPSATGWLVFVSVNAVEHGAHLIASRPGCRLAAVGPATAAALVAAGHPVDLTPAQGFDSEHLLASPPFESVAGSEVLIVRGRGGRELLAETLRSRGATVRYAEVYERRRSRPTAEALGDVEDALRRGDIQVVTATSAELLTNLRELLSPAGRAQLAKTAILAGGKRIAAAARAAGCEGPLVIAASPDDDGLMDALAHWQRHT